MNGFRITLLVMLGLAIGALLCIVTIFQNNQEENYASYQTKVQADARQQQIDEHKARMERIGPRQEDTSSEQLEQAAAEQQRRISEAQEQHVLATAQRQDAERMSEQAEQEANADQPLGLAASYDKEWGFLMVKPVSEEPLPVGTVIAIRRGGAILCEAEIGGKDEESGQFSATLRQAELSTSKETEGLLADKLAPMTGDEVILTPFPSSRDLRTGEGSSIMSVAPTGEALPAYLPSPEEMPADEGIQEVDAALTPMP